MKYTSPDPLVEMARIFNRNSQSLYLVGGAVRDYLLKKENSDYDLTTSATPKEVKAMFRRTIDTGIKHGTVTVIYKGEHYEITTFRTEGDYSDSRHPDSVTFVRSLEEDLRRRDFTINALAVDILTGDVIDMHGGIEDLEKGIIRAIGEPEERFGEDALRMMRACRFSSKLGFDIEEKTLDAIRKLNRTIEKVSVERIKDEMDKLLLSPYPVKGLRYMEETGLISVIHPSLSLSDHVCESLERAKRIELSLTSLYAVLLHTQPDSVVRETLNHLKASNIEKKEITLLSKEWFTNTSDTDEVSIRKYIQRIGKDMIPPLFQVRKAVGETEREDSVFEALVQHELDNNCPVEIKDLAVKGEDLDGIVEKGPAMGRMLKYLLECVIVNPEDNTKERLIELAREKELTRGF
jgi:tRNA nucleotidyltransferase (CCA-adding enzyme)